MRPVYFVKYFDKGSTILGGEQMVTALGELGVEARTVYAWELGGVRNSTLVFIKKGQIHHLLPARMRGNLLVLDVQDTLSLKTRLKNRRLYHGVLFRSQRPLDDYGGGELDANIYLQWNPRYRPNEVGDREFKLAYFGDPRSFNYWQQLPNVPCIGADRFFEEASHYNCHISIRTVEREFRYKPSCKVSTAAACHANLITTRDDASVETLGPDYPYFTEPNIESVLETIERARETFGGPLWHAGLEAMAKVRESHRLEHIARQYLDYLGRLEARAPGEERSLPGAA